MLTKFLDILINSVLVRLRSRFKFIGKEIMRLRVVLEPDVQECKIWIIKELLLCYFRVLVQHISNNLEPLWLGLLIRHNTQILRNFGEGTILRQKRTAWIIKFIFVKQIVTVGVRHIYQTVIQLTPWLRVH